MCELMERFDKLLEDNAALEAERAAHAAVKVYTQAEVSTLLQEERNNWAARESELMAIEQQKMGLEAELKTAQAEKESLVTAHAEEKARLAREQEEALRALEGTHNKALSDLREQSQAQVAALEETFNSDLARHCQLEAIRTHSLGALAYQQSDEFHVELTKCMAAVRKSGYTYCAKRYLPAGHKGRCSSNYREGAKNKARKHGDRLYNLMEASRRAAELDEYRQLVSLPAPTPDLDVGESSDYDESGGEEEVSDEEAATGHAMAQGASTSLTRAEGQLPEETPGEDPSTALSSPERTIE